MTTGRSAPDGHAATAPEAPVNRPGRVRVAVYARCADDLGRVLLCRVASSVDPDRGWTLPGGGLEFGEDPAAGVLRELAEETGLDGAVEGVAGVGGTLRPENGGSTDGCAWHRRAEVERLPLWDLAREALRLGGEG